ncbi:hypothetical protein GIB67_015584 [Kingdonia uniflora]|uniref:DAGKc domain-containing protein n=1 Tax=Kingdonia uniflora TaxID=39325 RepID=A0A7J7LU01_9MAGN|nr:hypothetical protein GIB67_015584 [Kingdonia uniflora]
MEVEEGAIMSSNFFLDHGGEVVVTLDSNGLSWKSVESANNELSTSSCLGIKRASKTEAEIKISDVYAVEFVNWGLIHETILPTAGGRLLGRNAEMYRFTVHGYQKSKNKRSLFVLASHTFGHKDLQTCQTWIDRIGTSISMETMRPKSLLVFVHPLSGKGNGCRTWDTVAPIFSRAKVSTKVIVTQKAGHALDVMTSITPEELNSYDGAIAVGGDGFFNEILNGLLRSRHKAPYPPSPTEIIYATEYTDSIPISIPTASSSGVSHQNGEHDPLLQSSEPSQPVFSKFGSEGEPCNTDQDPLFPLPNTRFRLGIIPAGSTDAIVICSTGSRDPVTSALHIVLGRRVCLDIAQVVRWKTTTTSKDEPFVRYAASFAGYGFYGDVIRESENYRWMGPKRYDYAGTKVFMKHRSYEAEISYLEVKTEAKDSTNKSLTDNGNLQLRTPPKKSERVICRVGCSICNETTKPTHTYNNGTSVAGQRHPVESRWLRSKGRFLSVGAAIIANRNERAPDGLVADAHLNDGFLHLILIKDCSHAFYLWHLTQLAKKGGNPLSFKFVEHYKTPAFTFTSSGNESVWNLDGELFQAHQLSVQVFRGLVSLFATGPEV